MSTDQSWPKTGSAGDATLIFSGSFNQQRISSRRRQRLLHRIGMALLGVIVILGAVGLYLSASVGLKEQRWDFLIQRSGYNLAFWTALLLTAYLWAQSRQHYLDNQLLNLLHWDSGSAKTSLDAYAFFNTDAKLCWDRAFVLAKSRQLKTKDAVDVSAIDLMLALLDDKSVETLFYRLSVDPKDLKILLRNYHRLTDGFGGSELDDIPFAAFGQALKLHNKAIDPLMLVCALKQVLPEEHILQDIFFNLDVSQEDLEIACSWIFQLRLLREDVLDTRRLAQFKPVGGLNRGLTAVPTPYLDRFSKDLTLLARYGGLPLAFGRRRDLEELFKLLADGRKNILIKGAPGTGRTTLLDELAYKMASEQVPASLSDMRLVKLEPEAILGSRVRPEQALEHSLQEAAGSGNIIIVISDLEELARAQASTGLSLLEVLLNFLQSSDVTVIATSTNEAYTDYLRRAANFDQIFTGYELRNLSRGEILLASCIKASLLEAHNHCLFRYPSIKQAVELTEIYIKDQSQPQKAISVLVEAASRSKGGRGRLITSELIEQVVSDRTHIPAQALNMDESYKLLHLEEDLSKFIVGQKEAVTAVAESLRRARSGLADQNRPLASFLFLGPTGVGKTEVAKTLAKIYFGDPKFLLRLDMSEYRGQEGIDKLLGKQQNKTDSGLVKHLKNYPFCLLLLDEFEKAGPEVLNLFLQILEDGRLTSGQGETIDATHCLIIATSNAGSADVQHGLKAGSNLDRIKAQLLDNVLTNFFPPELLNRFDGVVIFSPLSQEEITAIAHLQLELLRQQLRAKGIKADFSLAVAEDVAQKAYDPSLGARPIRRYIQDHVETFVAKLLLQKTLQRGAEIFIDCKDGKLTIGK